MHFLGEVDGGGDRRLGDVAVALHRRLHRADVFVHEAPAIAPRDVARGIGEEGGAAAGAAEVVGDADIGGVARSCDCHRHAAHRVDRLTRLVGRRRCAFARLRGAPAALDDLGHDAHRDLFGRARADVQSRRRRDTVQRLAGYAAREQRVAQLREPGSAAIAPR